MSGQTQPQQAQPQLTDAEKAALARVESAHSPTNPQDPSLAVPGQPKAEGFLGGKYKTAEELEAAYKSLQAEFTKIKQGAAPKADTQPQQQQQQQQTPTSLELQQAQQTQQGQPVVDFDAYSKKFIEQGNKLVDQDYADLEAKGIPRPVVDAYLRGIQASADDLRTTVFAAAGGEQAYAAMQSWANQALTPAQHAEFNALLNQGGSVAELAVAGLAAKWKAAVGSDGALITGTSQAPANIGFASLRELVNAQKDPRYGKDPVYTRDVERRAAASKW